MASNKKDLAAYVRSSIEDYEERLQLAFGKMERQRCSLRYADAELFDEIAGKVEDWEVDLGYEDASWKAGQTVRIGNIFDAHF